MTTCASHSSSPRKNLFYGQRRTIGILSSLNGHLNFHTEGRPGLSVELGQVVVFELVGAGGVALAVVETFGDAVMQGDGIVAQQAFQVLREPLLEILRYIAKGIVRHGHIRIEQWAEGVFLHGYGFHPITAGFGSAHPRRFGIQF